jgi:hypothetical protein
MIKLLKKESQTSRTFNYRGIRPMIVSLLLLLSILFLQKKMREQGPENLQRFFETLGGSPR